MDIDDYTFDKLVEALDLMEFRSPGIPIIAEFDLEDEYNDMIDRIDYENTNLAKEFPKSYEELAVSGNKDKLIEFMSFLGIDVGFGTNQNNFNTVFRVILRSLTKPEKGN